MTPLRPAVSGVRTGASFVQHGVTGCLVDRLPPGRQCVANEDDEKALAAYLAALAQVQAMDRRSVHAAAAERFATERIADTVLAALADCRTIILELEYCASACVPLRPAHLGYGQRRLPAPRRRDD